MIAERPNRGLLQSWVQTQAADLFNLLRVKQWTKNFIVFLPLLFAARVHELELVVKVCYTFGAFCLLSGAVYIVNDIIDCHRDKVHPLKCLRPIAAGRIPISLAIAIAVICAIAGMALSCTVSASCAQMAIAYSSLMLLYSCLLKRYVLLDVFVIAIGFVLRAVAGAIAASVVPSNWFLLCTSFGALFLALEKRRQELYLLKDNSVNHRRALTSYSPELLNRLQAIVVPGTLICYLMYCLFSYHGKAMLLTMPFVILGIMRYHWLSTKYLSTDMPEEILLKDKMIQAVLAIWLITSAIVVYSHAV